jgi:predicted SnoaL-like aldol condensation-catalyzing enzyme
MGLREIAESFMQLCARGHVRHAYQKYVATTFRHHNPNFAGDADSLMTAMEEDAKKHPDKQVEVRLSLEDGDYVAVHSHVRQDPDDRGGAVVHIFRFESSRIVELWDVGQDVPKSSKNDNGMF